jgi:two-component system, OmpR family, response regulator
MRQKILIMDDEQDTLSMLALTLKFSGFDVATAESGQKAIELVSQFQPDAIILDVMMPDLTGIEVLKTIKQQVPEMPPVIFLSASIRTKDQQAGLEAGAFTYLVKPVSREKLIETVKAALASRGR